MRVLLIGEMAPGALLYSYERGFRALGATVTSYATSQGFGIPGIRRLLAPLEGRRLNGRVVDDLRDAQADIVVVLKCATLTADTIRRLRASIGAPVVNFYPDDPFSEERSNRLIDGPRVLAAYDHCFTFARHLMPQYRAAGVREVHYLPFARDPELHPHVAPIAAPEFDAVFLGNLDAERVRWLESLAGLRVAIFGGHTFRAVARTSPLRDAQFFPAVYGPGVSEALARGALSINIMRIQNRGSHNMRTFESPAAGAFTLSQHTPELAELFREDEEIGFARDPQDMRVQAERWLADAPARLRVAAAGHRRVDRETYAARAQQLLNATGIVAAGRST